MPDATRPFWVHFLDHYWVDGPAPELGYVARVGRTYEVQVHGFESMYHVLRDLILDHPTDFSDEFKKAHEAGGFHIVLLKPQVDIHTWRGDEQSSEALWLIADPETGVVRFAPIGLPHQNATLDEIRATIDAGYVAAKPDEVVIVITEGIGGDGLEIDLVRWLLEQGVDLGLEGLKGYLWYKLISLFTKYVRNGRRDRRARAVARAWAGRQVFTPYQLRMFLDTKDAWTLGELSRALTIPLDVCRQLVKSLGYVRDAGNTWRLGTSKKARRRRQRWLDEEFSDPLGFHFDSYPSEPFEG